MATPDTVAITQDFVTKSIRAVFGDDFDTTVERWVPAHADLNWANVTASAFSLFDPEDPRLGPARRMADRPRSPVGLTAEAPRELVWRR